MGLPRNLSLATRSSATQFVVSGLSSDVIRDGAARLGVQTAQRLAPQLVRRSDVCLFATSTQPTVKTVGSLPLQQSVPKNHIYESHTK
jgi:hypothetical protein